MAGAWEIRKQASVLVGILHVETVTMAWAMGLRNLQNVAGILPVTAMPFDHARNAACMKALELGASHLFFLDSDVIPPPDAVTRLLARGVPLVSGVYARRSPPHGIPVMQRKGRWVMPEELPKEGLIEVDVVGAGCLLIRRDLLETVGKHHPQRPEAGKAWFDWRVDHARSDKLPADYYMSEDFTFNLHVKKTLGIPTLVDCGVVCRHVGMASATPGRYEPLLT